MTAAAPVISRHDLETKIIKRCWQSDAFRKEFVGDPAGCFARYLNAPKAQLPDIVIHEEQPGSWHIVLPAQPTVMGELSEEELEKIAGGTDLIAATCVGTGFLISAMFVVGVGTGMAVGYETSQQHW